MNPNPYHVRGESAPKMFGRKTVFAEVIRQLTKPNPEHLSIIGPVCCGKSVLLNAVMEKFQQGDKYACVVFWDLRSHCPRTDSEFLKQLATHISDLLRKTGSEVADYIDLEGDDILGDLALVLDEVWQTGKRVLVLMDGFDAVLAADDLTLSLWDNMLDLARKPGLRLVTASRSRLRELLKHNAKPSIFWDIFCQTPIEVGAFSVEEFTDLTAPFTEHGITFDSSAEKELFNETGGHPSLAAALLERLFDEGSDNSLVHGEKVSEAAGNLGGALEEIFSVIWDDCCAIEVGVILGRLSQGTVSESDIPANKLHALLVRGLAMQTRTGVQIGSRMFAAHVSRQAPAANSIADLFAHESNYETNIRSVLQLRAGQLDRVNPRFRSEIDRAIRDLVPEPLYAVRCCRGAAMCAFELIWACELENGRLVPQVWIDAWKSSSAEWLIGYAEKLEAGGRRKPSKGGQQCRLLNTATGSDDDIPRMTQHVSRQTYLLLDHIQSAGDYGQHQTDPVEVGFAAALCLSAIELGHRLALELPK